MDAQTLLRQYAEGKRDFGFASLRGVTLSGQNLVGIALYQSDLEKAVLVQADLSRSNLRQANLEGADLSQANLFRANLRRANLRNANLTGANLEGANLTGAILPDGMLYQRVEAELADSETSDSPLVAGDKSQFEASEHIPNVVSELSMASGEARSSLSATIAALNQDFRAPLLFQWLGFTSFGWLLALLDASGFNWIVAWLSAFCWLPRASFTWFVPLIAAIAVFNAAGISVVAVVVAGVISLTLLFTLKVMLNWTFSKALTDSFWVGGIVFILVQMASWLFYGGDAYSGGGIVLALDTLNLAVLLILAVGLTSLGVVVWPQMQAERFSRQQLAIIAGSISALGLLCGKVMTLLV